MPCRDVPYAGNVRPRKLVRRRDLLSLLPAALPLPAATPTCFGIETLRLKLGSDYRDVIYFIQTRGAHSGIGEVARF